jgi:predicted Zn-dependent protease with MMP-like domain
VITVSDERFEELVAAGIDAIPERFAQQMQNIAITVAHLPDQHQREKIRLRHGWLLFGLYEGVPRTRRGNNYTLVLPDKITIFKQPLEQVAQSEEHLRQLVTETVWHEIAHHFGLSDKEIHRRQSEQQTSD